MDLGFELGTIDPRMDVKVGDLVEVVIAEGHRAEDGTFTHVRVVNTIEVESVDDLQGYAKRGEVKPVHRWCRGPVVRSDSAAQMGVRGGMAYLGQVFPGMERDDVPFRPYKAGAR